MVVTLESGQVQRSLGRDFWCWSRSIAEDRSHSGNSAILFTGINFADCLYHFHYTLPLRLRVRGNPFIRCLYSGNYLKKICSLLSHGQHPSKSSILQIVGYIALRNASLALRGKHSALLAGLGRISLESLVAQGHIWLAADSHGVLVLLPRFPVLNLLVTSFIFICASHEVSILMVSLSFLFRSKMMEYNDSLFISLDTQIDPGISTVRSTK